jgi:hypothetical protein
MVKKLSAQKIITLIVATIALIGLLVLIAGVSNEQAVAGEAFSNGKTSGMSAQKKTASDSSGGYKVADVGSVGKGFESISGSSSAIPSCSDTDGYDENTSGSVSVIDSEGKSYTYDDTCYGDEVREIYCHGDEAKALNIDCTISSDVCYSGACQTISSCTDTDSGSEFDKGRVIQSFSSGSRAVYEDQCKTSTILTEYNCNTNDNNYNLVEVVCDEGCADAACVDTSCSLDSECTAANEICYEGYCVGKADLTLFSLTHYGYGSTKELHTFIGLQNNGETPVTTQEIILTVTFTTSDGTDTMSAKFSDSTLAGASLAESTYMWAMPQGLVDAFEAGETVELILEAEVDANDDHDESNEDNNKLRIDTESGSEYFNYFANVDD